MANQSVYPYGPGGSVPAGVGIINDLVTGGANVALSAEMGKTLAQDLQAVAARTKEVTDDDLTTGYVDNKFINTSGNIASHNSYAYKEFAVKAGSLIQLTCYSTTSTAVIAKKLTSTTFDPLVTGAYQYKTHEYTATEDMTIAVSYNKSWVTYPPRVVITYYPIASNTANIQNILNALAAQEQTDLIQGMRLGHLFEKIAVIGDSMSRGTLSSTSDDEVSTNSYGASWLSFLAKRWDCKGKFHYAMSGSSCYKWLNNSVYGLGRMLKDTTIYNAYFIAYGHNDSASVGSASDEAAPVTITESGGNYTVSCPDGYSFCAYYKAIIDQIRTKAPHAMIFCLSEYDGVMVSSKPTYRQAVIDVAEAYYNGGDTLVHHLETGGVNGGGGGMDLGTHYSTVGYAYIAKRVDEEAGKCVYQHRTDSAIKYFGGYNTDKTADSPLE